MRNNRFNILALSDYQGSSYSDPQRLGDLTEIITGGVGFLQSVFPNIFGGGRKRLNTSDWMQLIPGSGYWSNLYRGYMQSRIHYDVDFTTWARNFTMDFIFDHKNQICPEVPFSCWQVIGEFSDPNGGYQCTPCFTKFSQILQEESYSGGSYPVGNVPGFQAGFNFTAMAPYLIGGLALVLLLNKKKKR